MKIVLLIILMLLSIFGFRSSPTESELKTSNDTFSSPLFDFWVVYYSPAAILIFLVADFVGSVNPPITGPFGVEYSKSKRLLLCDNFCVSYCIEIVCWSPPFKSLIYC